MADALGLGPSGSNPMEVRLLSSAQSMKKIIINKDNSGIRLDKFLVKEFFLLGLTRGEIIRKIKNGEVLVNDKKAKPSYVLRPGDAISSKFKVKSSKLMSNQDLEIKVVYQDENIIVINKPAGVSVHPTKPNEKNTLVNFLIYKFPEIRDIHDPSNSSGQVNLRPGIVHRLDKDTSGVMVVARNQESFEELKKLFKEHKIEKKYLALVYGKFKDKEGVIEKPIARAANYRKQVIAGRKTKTKIREAMTRYRVIKEYENYSLVEAMPKTGRMHQIRIHMFSIGHPIAGDKIYKLKNTKKAEIFRQMLHAQSIEFTLLGKKYKFKAEFPKDLSDTLKRLDPVRSSS